MKTGLSLVQFQKMYDLEKTGSKRSDAIWQQYIREPVEKFAIEPVDEHVQKMEEHTILEKNEELALTKAV